MKFKCPKCKPGKFCTYCCGIGVKHVGGGYPRDPDNYASAMRYLMECKDDV